MKTVTINVEGASQSQWSTFLLELNLMKKAWRRYGVNTTLKTSNIKKIIALGTSYGETNKKLRRNSKDSKYKNFWYKLVKEYANGLNNSKRRTLSINSCHKASDGTYIFVGRSRLHGSVRNSKTKVNRIR